MKLSFVIPAYNEERYLGHCLHSVLKQVRQTDYDIEVVVVNNASTDRTREVARRFPEVILVDEMRKGLSRARQAGYVASTGDLIANVDADALLPDGWIQTVMDRFGKNPRLVGLSGPPTFYDASRSMNFLVRLFNIGGYITYLLNRFVFRTSSVLQGGNFVIRRVALDRIGGYNPVFDFYGEDADIAHRLHAVGPVVYTFRLPIMTSGRRVAAEGKFTTAGRYFVNYIWAIFFGRPFTKTALDVRPVDSDNS